MNDSESQRIHDRLKAALEAWRASLRAFSKEPTAAHRKQHDLLFEEFFAASEAFDEDIRRAMRESEAKLANLRRQAVVDLLWAVYDFVVVVSLFIVLALLADRYGYGL